MILATLAPLGGSAGPIGPQLHAPDGFLSVPVGAVMWVLTIIVLAYSVRQTNRTLDERAIPLMGVMAAFIFAAQMFNFQVVGGTSGHLLGGVLAAVLLSGPATAQTADRVVFENPSHDYPKRVIYERTGADRITASIDAGSDDAKRVDYAMTRQACDK